MIVQKQDGAFLYATTDLATIQYRMKEWQPDTILYVVDHRQSFHFEQLFATAKLWGYGDVELQHIAFGTVLGEDGRPFKTRSGTSVGLAGLLDEAVERAYAIVSQNDDNRPEPLLSEEERRQVAEQIGIGAIKYADLAHNRTSDYVFSYDKMLAMTGNTAAYMQYSYARVRSIFAKGGLDETAIRDSQSKILLTTPQERRSWRCTATICRNTGPCRRRLSAESSHGLPVRIGDPLQRFLRELPGAEGRDRIAAHESPAIMRIDGPHD